MKSPDFSNYLILPTRLQTWGSTQSHTEMSIRNLPGGGEGVNGGRCEVDNLSTIYELIVYNM
jgi:hypothetical protein